MKYYESHYEDYISSIEKYNLHPELTTVIKMFPPKLNQLENMIIYGPPGVGKYSQVLNIIKKYSPSDLKYDKKITVQTDKQQYIYRMSDVHYEIDMSLLGCNSKIIWHELFFQIVDIISIKTDKIGIILCKNFNLIHTELLDIFYSYMQQYNHTQTTIKIKFFLMMEHISFLPTPIINACHILRIGRPTKEKYAQLAYVNSLDYLVARTDTSRPLQSKNSGLIYDSTNNIQTVNPCENKQSFIQRITNYKNIPIYTGAFNTIANVKCAAARPLKNEEVVDKEKYSTVLSGETTNDYHNNVDNIFKCIDVAGITNIKEIRSFPLIQSNENVPNDIFNIICDNIIKEILSPKTLSFTGFRDTLYDMLTYNLDMTECLWYILQFFIENNYLTNDDVTEILINSYTFLKYYNNNYRPIYHLESIMFIIINKIHTFNEL